MINTLSSIKTLLSSMAKLILFITTLNYMDIDIYLHTYLGVLSTVRIELINLKNFIHL